MPRYEWTGDPNILGALDPGVQVSRGSNYTLTPEPIRPELKNVPSRHHWTWIATTESPLTWLAMAPAATKVSLKNGRAELDSVNCTLTYDGLENAKG